MLLFQLDKPYPDPAASIVVQEADPGLLEGGLNTHQGRDIAHHRALAAPGDKTSIPNRSVLGWKSRRLNVTIA